jgi:hypothetical protein
MHNDDIPAAFAVARAEFGAVEMVRCSCGALYPKGGKCVHAPQGEAVRLFTPAPAQLEGQGFWALEVEPLPARVTRDLI